MDRKSRHVTEIPCLAVDKLMSIFKPDPDDVYNSGLLIGRRESQGATHPDIAFVHPFSINGFVLLCCEKGNVTISTNSDEFLLEEDMLYINFPGQIMSATKVNDCHARVVVIDIEHLNEMNLDLKPMAQKLLVLKYSQSLKLTRSVFLEINRLIDVLEEEIRNHADDEQTIDVLRGLLTALFYKIGRVIDQNINESKLLDRDAFNKNSGYFREFMSVLRENYKRERSVTFYATQLRLSPKYFTTLIKRISGRTAAEWINQTVIMEAKNLLKYSTMNVQEIAYSLNFPNQSFFGKYFKHHTGMTPSQYKRL